MVIPKRPLKGRLLQSLLIVAIVAAISGYFLFRPNSNRTSHTITPDRPGKNDTGDISRVYTPEQKVRLAVHRTSLDPKQDGWCSEALSEVVEAQIKIVANLWSQFDSIDADHVLSIVADDFHCSLLRPSDLQEVYADETIAVLRPAGKPEKFASDRFHDAVGLAEALRDLALPLAETSQRRTKVKTVQMDDAKTSFTTVHIVETSGQTDTGTVEQHARWNCQWSSLVDGTPKLRSIRLENYEETVVSTPHKTWFMDCTEAVVGDTRSFRQQLAFGLNHWLARIETRHGMYVFAEYGIGLGDVNGDGLDDI